MSEHKTNLRPQLRALRELRNSHRQLRLYELEPIAIIELMKMYRILDQLTWEETEAE